MPCPYFYPTELCADPLWPHPERLSLGSGFHGRCTAPGNEGFTPGGALLHDCNLGHAGCAHLPADRAADAVHFSVRRDPGGIIRVAFVAECAHAPVAKGTLTFETVTSQWRERHVDACLQRMAECRVGIGTKEK